MCGFSQKVWPQRKAVPNTGVCLGSLHIVGVQERLPRGIRMEGSKRRNQHLSLPPALWGNDAFVAVFEVPCTVTAVTSEESGPDA